MPLTTDADTKDPKRMTYPVQIAVLASLYVATGLIGVNLDFYHKNVSLVWLPSGLSLAALILYGRRLWPGVLLGSLALNAFLVPSYPVGIGTAAAAAFAAAVGNMLEALVGAWVVVDHFGFRPTLARVRDVVVLVLFGGVFATVISAGIGVTALWLGGDVESKNFLSVALLWWLGALGGVVTLTPFLLLLRNGTPAWATLARNPEFWIVTSLLVVSCLVAFGGIVGATAERLAMQLPLPCLAWAGVRLGTRGAVAASFSTIAIAAVATAQGLGPLAASDPQVSMTLLWGYSVGMGSTVLILAAAIAQRDAAEIRHQSEVAERQRAEREHLLTHERERIVRDMHDGLGGQLISLLSMVQRGQASDDEVAEGLRRSLDDMRIVIDSLEIRKSGLQDPLGKLRVRLDPLLRRNGLRLEWRIDERADLDGFTPEQALHCVRVIQEASSNVIQHARASEIEITVSAAGEQAEFVVIEIRDNGIGIIPGSEPGGRGTRNMIARAHALGALLSIEPAEPGRRIRLSIPIAE
jgi:signal transduction histidine kinase